MIFETQRDAAKALPAQSTDNQRYEKVEYATFSDTLQLAVQYLCLSIQNWLRDLIETGRREGSMHFEEDPTDRALMLATTLQSVLLLNRVIDDEAVFETLVDQMLEGLGVPWRIADVAKWDYTLFPKHIHSYS